jgi:DNA-binding XRE family transcriptional regulator
MEPAKAQELPPELRFTPEELAQGRRKAQREAVAVLLRSTKAPHEGDRLGDWLRAVRIEQGLTAAEIADLLGLSERALLDLEEGQLPAVERMVLSRFAPRRGDAETSWLQRIARAVRKCLPCSFEQTSVAWVLSQ